LQDRGRALEDQGDQADLRKAERKVVLQQRIGRRDQRLHQVIQEMTKRHGKDDLHHSGVGRGVGGLGIGGHGDLEATGTGQDDPSLARNGNVRRKAADQA
jgi:hypothetical protein